MTTVSASDSELVRQILSGNRDTFSFLVERYLQSALAIARARLVNPIDADDAVQEAFLRAFQQLRTLREPAKFGPWVLTIVRHEAARLVARHRTTIGADPDTAPDVAAEPNPSQREIHALLRTQVMNLPEPAREVLLLHYFAGHSSREVATLLDLRHATVRKRLQRARVQLAETLLHELESARPSSENITKQAARITALASALAIPQATSMASAAVVTAGSATAMKWALGVLFALGIAAALALLPRLTSVRTPASAVSTQQAIETTPVAEAASAPLASESPSERTSEIVAPADLMEAAPAAESAGAAALNETLENLTGSWHFWLATVAPSKIDGNDYFEFLNSNLRLEDNGVSVKIICDEEGPIVTKGDGKIAGNRLTMDFSETHAGSQKVAHLEGKYEPSAVQMYLKGWVRWDTLPTVDRPDGYVGEQRAATLVWDRKSTEQLAKSAFVDARVDEINALYKALVAYANDHQHRMPERLQELVPHYLPGLSQFTPAAGVTSFTYTPLEYLISGDEARDILHEAIRPIDGDPNRERQQRIDLEKLLGRFARPDNSGRPRTIAEASYDQFDLDLVLNAFGDWRRHGRHCNEKIDDHATSDELVIACGKHMENATSAVMNFTNAWTRGAQGWLTLLAWIEDECMLYCPGRKNQIIAREILFPSSTTRELEATYESLFGPYTGAPERGLHGSPGVHAHIPIVIETEECSHSGGRHVGFLDGHVEFRNGRLEDYPDLAPFLRLK